MKFIEVFSTWQGEGPDAGKRMLLCRFKTCDRRCYYCDTIVKMRSSVESEYSIEQLQKVIDEEKCGLMITGGEPTFESNIDDTITLVKELKVHGPINIETNGFGVKDLIGIFYDFGTITNFARNFPSIILSPKIFTEEDLTFYKDIINYVEVVNNTIIHFPYYKLVYTYNDVKINNYNDMFLQYLMENSKMEPNRRVYLMPEGKTKEELIKTSPIVFDKCEEWKVNFSSREHIIYGFI